MRISSAKRGWIAAALVISALTAAILVFGTPYATRIQLDEAAARGQTTLSLAVSALRGHMRRYEALPALIADDDDIKRLLADPTEPQRTGINAYLKLLNRQLEASDIYVMKPDGDTIAASNYDGPTSFVGENFSYRPYFQQAAAGGLGRFFALGTTSLKRGYYFAAPVRIDDVIAGVVVVKVDIEPIEAAWKSGDYEFIVSDPEGIIFMTGRKDWLYAGLLPLTPERLARTESSRRYANAVLRELPIEASALGSEHKLMTVREANAAREYLVLQEHMAEADWTVQVLLDTQPIHAQARTGVVGALLLMALATLAATIIFQRRAQLAERMELQRSAREQLEHRVEERTADLATVNRRLETEVVERTATEVRLRQTQSDLVQAGKLAALGQMSAALSHEFNQPLAAVKNYADNAAVLIERNRIADARDNVSRISALIDRMASISRHLRNFARKPNEQLGPVNLADVMNDTMEIVSSRLKSAGRSIEIDIDPPSLAVRAGSVRLQQVLVNIISNAADAMEGSGNQPIAVTARQIGERAIIEVRDHGPGVQPAIAERIFDPFFTTKGVGKGLGLGLSISYNIVKDFGGSLSVANHPDGGAVFTVELDLADAKRLDPPAAEAAE